MFDATLGHAKRTLAASELLLTSHYLPQAYSLGHIALEELSKVRLLFAFWLMLGTGWSEPDWPGFWKAWSNHGAKNRLLILGRLEEELRSEAPPNQDDQGDNDWTPPPPDLIDDQLSQAASRIQTLGVLSKAAFPLDRAFNEMRLRATYVDFRNGKVLLPEEMATQVEIEGLHAFAQRTVHSFDTLWPQRGAMQAYAQQVGPRMLEMMVQSYNGEGPHGS